MQKILTVFIILISLGAFGQNWSLISTDYQYHYFQEDVHTATIAVDSMEVIGNDVMFYLNRIVVECDTCEQSWLPYFLYNQPNFLQKKVLLQDSVFRFLDTNEFAIMPYAPVGTNWTFDTINNITASIIGASMVTTFGETDSLKLISLSNGYSIVLSKNFGIKSFQVNGDEPEFQLKGVQGINDFGYYVPDMEDYYDYEVGDVFLWSSVSVGPDGGENENSFYYQVESIIHTDTSVVLEIGGCSVINPMEWPYQYESFQNSNFVIDKRNFANASINEFFNVELYSDWGFDQFVQTRIISVDNEVAKKFEYFILDTFASADLSRRDELQYGNLMFKNKSYRYAEDGFEYAYEESNTFLYNLDTFYCDYLSIPEINVNEHFTIAPNPASEKITINRNSVLEPYEITVFNLQGQLVQSDTWKAGIKAKSLNVASLPKGMYLVKFRSKNQLVGEEKFVKID